MIQHTAWLTGLLGAALLGLAGAMAMPEPFTIADGRSGAAPVGIAPTASEATRAQVEELAEIIEQMCGRRPTITTEAAEGRTICVGTVAEFPDAPRVGDLEGEGPEAFVLHSTADRLYIIGNSDLGAQQGIFTLLRQLGCRWFFAHEAWTVIPRQRRLQIDISAIESPDYDYRIIWYGWGARTEKTGADLGAWWRHNRMCGWFARDCGHAYANFCPSSLFEKHPEYFGLVDGRRQAFQPCTTNPDVIQLAIDYALRRFEQEPERNMLSFDPNDNGEFCECDRCKAVGTISDRVFLFANQVAEAVAARFPDKYVGLLAYAWHTEPPSFKLDPNVYVQLTRGLRRTEMTWEEQISAWSEKVSSFGVYDYFSLHEWDGSMPGKAKGGNLDYLRSSIPFWHSLGATTLDGQSGCNWGPNGLGYYLAAQLTWDVEADADAIIDDFYAAAFGKAAGPVRRFYERWQEGNEMSERTLVLSYRDLHAARELAGRRRIERRLDHLMMYLHWLRLRWEFEMEQDPAAIITKGHELIQFSRRIMDTGIIHSYAMVLARGMASGWEWFDAMGIDHGFRKLIDLENVTDEMVETWRTERTDIPGHYEVVQLFEEGLQAYGDRAAAEVLPSRWSHDLVPVDVAAADALLALLGDRAESPFFCEKAMYYFATEASESLTLPFIPYPDHTLDVHWTLKDGGTGAVVQEGDIHKPQNESAEIRLRIPHQGLYVLNPGTNYLKGGRLELGRRPLVVEASRESEFMPVYPRMDEPLYFFVPRGTESFVLRVHSAGSSASDIRIYGPAGQVVSDNPGVVSGRDMSGMVHLPLTFGVDISVTVPAGADARIWAFSINSVRSTIQLLGVPPYVARHPDELLVPREAAGR